MHDPSGGSSLKTNPKKIEIEVTTSCSIGLESNNLGCLHCSVFGGTTLGGNLSFGAVRDALRSWSNLGGKKAVLTGGEPLMWQGIFEAIEYAKSLGYQVIVYTSGYRLPQETLTALADTEVNEVFLSIHGPETTHDAITKVNGSFQETMSSVRELVEAGTAVSAYFTPTKINVSDLRAVVRICEENGIGKLKVLGLILQGRAFENRKELELSREEKTMFWRSFLDLKGNMEKHGRVRITSGGMNFCFLLEGSGETPSCSAWKTACAITSEGDVIPCLALRLEPGSDGPHPIYVAGNIHKSSLEEIWRREDYPFGLLRDPGNALIEGSCSQCSKYEICRGGCAARRHLNTGSILQGPDYDCLVKP